MPILEIKDTAAHITTGEVLEGQLLSLESILTVFIDLYKKCFREALTVTAKISLTA